MASPSVPERRARPRPPVRRRAPEPPAETEHSPSLAKHVTSLQRTVGNAATTELILMRHKVAGVPVHRHKRPELFDPPGTSLDDFVRSTERQADWFAEPSLTAADRTDLHALLRRTGEGPQILAAVGDLLLSDLRGVAAADWPALAEYGRGRRNEGQTVRLIDPAPRPLADRIAMGKTLLSLTAAFPAATLAKSVSEAQFLDVHRTGLVAAITAYVLMFRPNLEMSYEPAAGARPLEFQNMIALLSGPGTAPFATLLGRVRDLHRFPVPMLVQLVANFTDVSRRRPVHLILHGSRDAAGAFQASAGLFAALVADSRNLHLMLEGADSIATLTAVVPTIAATYGKKDASGTPRIGQVMIAGHGEAQQVDLAQNDSMDINPANAAQRAKTQALLDALMQNMDPATARLVYAGCLVGSNPVAAGTPAAAMAAQIAANPNLAAFTEQRAAAAGLTPGRTQAARAGVGLSASSSFMDASGNMAVQYPFDPNAFADAVTYVRTGHEPEGLFRAAVEVAVGSGPVAAENALRTRQGAGVSARHGWFDQVIISGVNVALAGIAPGAGVPAEKLNMLAHMVGPPFLVGNAEDGHGRTVASLVGAVNSQPLARDLYAQLSVQGEFVAPSGTSGRNARFVIEQAMLNAGIARAAPLIAWLDGTASATPGWMDTRLDTGAIQAASPALFPVGAAATSGRIRLALAWLHKDPANADVRAFLLTQVVRPASGPELSPAVRAERVGQSDSDILRTLGVVSEVPGPDPLPAANAQVRRGRGNEVRIEPHPYQATVIPAGLNVRTLPGMHGRPFEVVRAGDVLQVSGFTHEWAAVDRNGRLGFVLASKITPP